MPSPRLIFCMSAALVAVALAAAPARAGEVVATAQGGTGATPPAATASSTGIATTERDGDILYREGPLPDHKVHGEVTVGVGTNGYREVSGVVAGPIGKDGEMMIAIDVGSENQRRRYGP